MVFKLCITCDYRCKLSMTCGPMSQHLTDGMDKLEKRMKEWAEEAEAQQLQMSFPLPPLQDGRGLNPNKRGPGDGYVDCGHLQIMR